CRSRAPPATNRQAGARGSWSRASSEGRGRRTRPPPPGPGFSRSPRHSLRVFGEALDERLEIGPPGLEIVHRGDVEEVVDAAVPLPDPRLHYDISPIHRTPEHRVRIRPTGEVTRITLHGTAVLQSKGQPPQEEGQRLLQGRTLTGRIHEHTAGSRLAQELEV